MSRVAGRSTRAASAVPRLDAAALLFLAAVSAALFWDGLLLGRLHFEADTTEFYYPILVEYGRALAHGSAPFWVPEVFGGYPLYADGEIGVFSPINFLAVAFFSPVSALVGLRIAKVVLASWFSYAYGRAIGLTRVGSMVAGLVFALGSFLTGQLHHSNITNTAIWLPLILCFIELAVRPSPFVPSLSKEKPAQGSISSPRTGRRYAMFAGAGVALGVAGLGLHVQVLLMILLVVTPYIAFRCLLVPLNSDGLRQRLTVMIQGLSIVLGTGFGLSMVQLLPLWELSRIATRGSNLGYAFASTYSMTPPQIVALLFPYFFRDEDRVWWSLWAEWESTLYIGVAPLLLALLGALLVRSRYTAFFLALGGLAMLLSLGAYAPLDLHRRLWELPGFDLMRAPGRFIFLAVFAGAVLAGLGADRLDRLSTDQESFGWFRRLSGVPRPVIWGVAILVAVLLTAGVAGMLAASRGWVEGNEQIVLEWARRMYITEPTSRVGLTPQRVYESLLQSLDARQLRTGVSLGLLAVSVVVLGAIASAGALSSPLITHHSSLSPQRVAFGDITRRAWRLGLLLLVAGDLLFFARGFHPMIWRDELEQPQSFSSNRLQPGSATAMPGESFVSHLGDTRQGLFRAYGDPWPADARPNRLLPWGVGSIGGYTSLSPTRHQDYGALLHASQRTLLSLAGVRYVVRSAAGSAPPGAVVQGMSYQPDRPLIQGAAVNPNARATFRLAPRAVDTIKLIAGLEGALELQDGTPIAEIIVVGSDGQREAVVVRVGEHISDQQAGMPELTWRLRHQRAKTVAYRNVMEDPWYYRYEAVVSYAELALPRGVDVPASLEFRTILPQGRLKVYGLALHAKQAAQVHQIEAEDEERYRLVYEDAETRIFETNNYLPRVFLRSEARFLPSDRTTLRLMAEGAFDLGRTVWLEGAPADTTQPGELGAASAASEDREATAGDAEVVSYTPTRVVVNATAARPGYLVLTDSYYPGWSALVDGVRTPIYRADYLYRAVPLTTGSHRVEFVFEPQSVMTGALVSLATAGLVLGLFVLLGTVRPSRRVNRA